MPPERSAPDATHDTDFLAGGGELGALIRAHDWEATPLGAPASWPRSLKTAVRIMLTSRQPIWIGWGPELIYLYNDPYKSIIGGKHPWALGKPTRTVWSEIWKDIQGMLANALGGDGTYVESQLLIMERNGYPEETYYTFSYSPIPGDDGLPSGIICANTDETQRVIGERQMALLRELAARTAHARSESEACEQCISALETSPRDIPFAAIYVAAPGAASLRLGCRTQAAGTPAAEEIAPDEPPWHAGEVLRTGEPHVVEGRIVVLPLQSSGDSGSSGVLVVGLNPHRLFDAGYRGFLTLVAKQAGAAIAHAEAWQAEQRRAEALAEIDRAKTVFFSNVSHEFRTPLTLMLGPLEEVIARRERLAEVDAELLDVAHRNSLRLLRLVNALLDFSRIEAGRTQALFQPTPLAEFTREIASNFEVVTQRAGLALRVDCPPLPEPVHVDRSMWEKVVLNLLSNAFKFTFDGEIAVTVRPDPDGAHAVLAVSDTGVGIPPEELPRLFERFHRVQGQKSRSFEGSGIGLALVNELVRLHGGRIAADSEPGRGATFEITLPFGTAHLPQAQVRTEAEDAAVEVARTRSFVDEALRWLPAQDAEQATRPPAEAGRARIVVADDNADMRDYVCRLLREHWDVEAVADGAEALAAVRRERPALLITDVMMPVVDGYGLLREIRGDASLGNLPVIMLSARAGEEAKVVGLEAGADDYLVKPFSARELVARVQSNLTLAAVRRQADAAMRESEARFRNMAEHAPLMMWVTEADGSCVYLNRRWYEFTGQHAEQALGTGWLEAVHPDDSARTGLAFARANERRESFQLEYRLRRADGAYRWAIDAGAPRFTDGGDFVGFVGSVIDITERKEAAEMLQGLNRSLAVRVAEAGEQDRRKNEFLATLAHELRNPLAPLRNGVELIKRVGVAHPDRLPDILAMMDRQLAHMVRLVDDLMDVSRVSRGTVELRRERITLAAVVESALEASRPLAERAGHVLSVRLPAEPVWLEGDAVRLAQVLGNVLNNAVKYTPARGRIELRAAPAGATVVIEVEDNGVGVPPAVADRMFELFVQGDETRATSQGGLGIGLSLVRRLVEMHGGVVQLTSAGRGLGTTVRITLPLAASPVAAESAALAPQAAAARALRVLVVDDNVDAADSLGMLLSVGGHDVQVVHSGRAAVDAAGTFSPQLVFLDLGLPDLNGYEVAMQLRSGSAAPGTRIVALTGWGNEEARERTARAGFDLHITKPVAMEQVQEVLAGLHGDRE